MMMIRAAACFAALSGVLSGGAANAQSGMTGWQGGLVTRAEATVLGGDATQTQVLPYLRYSTDRFSIGLDGVRLDLLDQPSQGMAVLLRPRFPLLDDRDAAFTGMSRDPGLDFGARYALEAGAGLGLAVSAFQGLTDDQQGQELDVRLSRQIGDLPVTVYAGAAWQSEELTEYLYGVRSAEAAGGRPAFSPGGAVTPYVGVSGRLSVSDSAAIIGSLETQHLPEAITDSPIVDSSSSTRATLGVVFNF